MTAIMTEGQANLTPCLVFAEEIYHWKPYFKIINDMQAASRKILKTWKKYFKHLSPHFHLCLTTFTYLYMHRKFIYDLLVYFWFMFIEFLITSIHIKTGFFASGKILSIRYEANSSFLYLKSNFGWEIHNYTCCS